MDKKVLTIIVSVVLGLLLVCSVVGLFIWRSSESNLSKLDEIFTEDPAVEPSSTPINTKAIEALNACDYFTIADAKEILAAEVTMDLNDGSNACTYKVENEVDDPRKIAFVILTTGTTESANIDFQATKSYFQENDIEEVVLELADSAFYAVSTDELYVLKDNHYFIMVARDTEYDNHLNTAKLAASKVLARL